jgi:pimeloyl-ACP methyl ester carboxylesterase
VAAGAAFAIASASEREITRQELGHRWPDQKADYVETSAGMTHYELSGPPEGAPVVLVHGVSGPMTVWDEVEAISGLALVTIDAAAHLPHYERPEKVNPTILEHVGRHRGD